MCGIIYAKNLKDSKPVNMLARYMYLVQRSRGSSGFGAVGYSAKKTGWFKDTEEKAFLADLQKFNYDEILLHHRFPTSTANYVEAAHPFIIKRAGKTFYFVHNGIITNDDELEKEHKKKGIKYSSAKAGKFNDSEALAYDFVLYILGEQQKMNAQGMVAFVCIQADTKSERAEKVFFYTNDEAPLNLFIDENLLLISSEGEGDKVKPNKLFFYDYATKQLRKVCKLKLPYYHSYTWDYGGGYGGFKRFTGGGTQAEIGFKYDTSKKGKNTADDQYFMELEALEAEKLDLQLELDAVRYKSPMAEYEGDGEYYELAELIKIIDREIAELKRNRK